MLQIPEKPIPSQVDSHFFAQTIRAVTTGKLPSPKNDDPFFPTV